MKDLIRSIRAHWAACLMFATALVFGPAQAALATGDTVDIATPVKNTVLDNITAAAPSVAAILGVMIGIAVVVALVKKARSA